MIRAGDDEVRIRADADLALPRPPGVIRRFWARHPLFTDILIALASLFLSSAGAGFAATRVSWPIATLIVVLTVASSAALVLRRRLPLLAFTLAIALELTAVSATHGAAAAPLLLATSALAVYGTNMRCIIAAASGTVLATGVSAVWLSVTAPALALSGSANTFFSVGLSVLIGALVGVNIGNRKRYVEAIIDRSRQLLIERDQQAELAAAAERERIAREMHDVVSHSLTVIVALTEGASATGDAERAHEAMTAASSTARSALVDMRTMLGVLRSDEPDAPLAPMQAISPADVVSAAQRAGFPVSLSTRGGPIGAPAVAYAVGRIVQEGLTNAMRHAPGARSIRVSIVTDTHAVTVTVANDGVTATKSAPGFGLRGLSERARHVGGTLASGPDGPGRWMLRAELPLDAGGTRPRQEST